MLAQSVGPTKHGVSVGLQGLVPLKDALVSQASGPLMIESRALSFMVGDCVTRSASRPVINLPFCKGREGRYFSTGLRKGAMTEVSFP